MTALLQTHELRVRYGSTAAIDGVTLHVDEGSIAGLIGPNGAGKSTFVDAICGFTPAASGHIDFDGRPIDGMRAHQLARLGLTRTFQSLELFEDLTVRENLQAGLGTDRWYSPLVDAVRPGRKRHQGAVDEALERTGLGPSANRQPGALSHGQRRMVALARALAAQPRLVLLDEPGAGLDPDETQALAGLIRALPDAGITVLLIDHDMGLVMSTCQRVWVLDFGQVIATGTPGEIRRDPTVITAYLGQASTRGSDPT